MKTIERPTMPVGETQGWRRRSDRATIPVAAAVMALVGVAVASVAVIVFFAVVALIFGSGSSQSVESGASQVVIENQPRSEAYFANLALARGSSIDTSVAGVASVDDIDVLSVPAGIDVTLWENADGVRMTIELDDDLSAGSQTIDFWVAGEVDPISWSFEILAR